MKRIFLLLIISLTLSNAAIAQSRGVKIGYIDMEYILEKVPDYAEAKNQLEEKAQKWKQEIEAKKIEINKLREGLKTEKVLLTKELIAEREEEITFLDNELLEYQQKRFGPNGDLMVQKAVLVKPIQDQVFNAVQDLAEAKKYDYIFDKSSDLTMLFAAKRFDVSDRVVSILTRADKRKQMSNKDLKKEAEAERKQDMIDDNPEAVERQKLMEGKKEERQKLLDERKLAAAEKKKAFEEKRKQLQADKTNKKTGTVSDNDNLEGDNTSSKEAEEAAMLAKLEREQKLSNAAEAKKKTLEERQKLIDERKKALEDKKQKAVEERETLKKAKEQERINKQVKP